MSVRKELTKADRELLSRHFLFKDLSAEERLEAYGYLRVMCFDTGETVYTEDQFARALGLVLRGECRVTNHLTELNQIRPGGCFGAAALFVESKEYVTTIRAVKQSKVAFLSGDDLTVLLSRFPLMALSYIRFLSERILFLNHRIDSFTAPTAEGALLDYLKVNADETGLLTVTGGYARLARELSMGRATLYRALDRLQESGQIRKDGNTITLI